MDTYTNYFMLLACNCPCVAVLVWALRETAGEADETGEPGRWDEVRGPHCLYHSRCAGGGGGRERQVSASCQRHGGQVTLTPSTCEQVPLSMCIET